MGNRAVITLDKNISPDSLGIYLHWNGGAESVMAFAQAAHDLGALGRGSDDDYSFARLVQVVTNFFGGTLSVGVAKLRNLDTDNHDNGLFVIGVVDDKPTLLQYPRGLTKPSAEDDPYYFAPRAVNYDSVSTHPYWKDPETGAVNELLNEVKQRNAAPFSEWKQSAEPELLAAAKAALSALEDPDFDEYMGLAQLTEQLTEAINNATK
jgi:hypothetical protein